MRRSAFTLMEMLVSVVLLVLITLFMYSAIAGSNMTAKTLQKHSASDQNRTLLYALLFRDCVEALWVRPMAMPNKHFTVLQMQTRNTLYDIAAPYVTYYVNGQSKALIRLESATRIRLPVSYEQKPLIHADVLGADVTSFNVYAAALSDTNTTDGNASAAGGGAVGGGAAAADQNGSEPAQQLYNRFLIYLDSMHLQNMVLEIAL